MKFGNMSKIGKKKILIPSGVTISIDGGNVVVKGPKGELRKTLPGEILVKVEGDSVSVEKGTASSGVWGLGRALLANMINGVSQGFQKILDFNGVGFKAQVNGNQIQLNLGFTNPVVITEFFTDNTLLVDKNLRLALKLFESFRALDIIKPIGLLGGELMRTKTVLFIADALIAATCLHYNLVLSTNNQKDFKKVKGLKFWNE